MTMDYSKYPADWKAISLRIRERAGWKCEQCGVANGAVGARDHEGVWHDEDSIHGMQSDAGIALFGEDFPDMTRIVLTVHHVGAPRPDGTPGDRHDKMDCRDENLLALCQRCHWLADIDIHIAKSKEARARKRDERRAATGQLSLFEETL